MGLFSWKDDDKRRPDRCERPKQTERVRIKKLVPLHGDYDFLVLSLGTAAGSG